VTAVRSGRLAEKARRSSLGPVAFALASQRMENRSRKSYFKRSITCCNTQAEFENFHECCRIRNGRFSGFGGYQGVLNGAAQPPCLFRPPSLSRSSPPRRPLREPRESAVGGRAAGPRSHPGRRSPSVLVPQICKQEARAAGRRKLNPSSGG